MAIWRTWTRADGTRGLLYRNLFTGVEHHCGVLAASTCHVLTMQWILTQEAAVTWDLISFDSGAEFLLMPPGARA